MSGANLFRRLTLSMPVVVAGRCSGDDAGFDMRILTGTDLLVFRRGALIIRTSEVDFGVSANQQ